MARPRNPFPPLSFHKPSKQFYLRLHGKMLYLGTDRGQAEQERARLLAESQVTGLPPSKRSTAPAAVLVNDALEQYRRDLTIRHTKHNRFTTEVHLVGQAVRPLRRLYGHLSVAVLSTTSLLAVQQEILLRGCGKSADSGRGCNPKTTNQHMGRITRWLRWCVQRGYCSASLWHEAKAIEPLKVARNALARLTVAPPPAGAVEDTLPYCSPVLAGMVRVQMLTGARPGEICSLTPGQIDRTGERLQRLLGECVDLAGCWVYIVESHKTEHHGHLRLIALGPQAQVVLAPFLAGRCDTDPVFSPAESYRWHRQQQRQARQTPVQPSQQNRSKPTPWKKPGRFWTSHGYAHAVAKAVKRANAAGGSVPHWHPHQLRHAAATEIERLHGWNSARQVLGHTSFSTTRIYVKNSAAAAFRVMGEVG